MKLDMYTKIILTIIAINLSFFSLNNLDLVPKVFAGQNNPSIINTNYGLVPINDDGTISGYTGHIVPPVPAMLCHLKQV